ncbi:SPRY-domain-containing protein [Basidiobolus meristosporus CBS 931.73]|uniref:SPRY-domain-containing protein n=1 Tax=Basidiobolus meristosporus CBS 931.73 TaxID=1314790 RepID=A0A1Y1YYG7_9FUNG|nr:SPRY-domain-containing protein [Basidiobolus meristosporus CBS 931.73]|eukprot:ORY03088.1 SPRY-domain-containing protein [Basidiobolus meristosporus CBS 931.73]
MQLPRILSHRIFKRFVKGRYARLIRAACKSMNPDSEKEALSEASDILISLSQRESEFIQIVLTMVEILDESEPLSSAFLCHILELAALPSVKAVLKLSTCLLHKIHAKALFRPKLKNRYRINSCIVWCVLAERLAGKVSASMLTNEVLNTLLEGLQTEYPWAIQHLSLVALENFSLTSENKARIMESNVTSLIRSLLETSPNAHDRRQVAELAICAPWALKCSFSLSPSLFLSKEDSEIEALENINVTLNWCDATSRLKWNPTGLVTRNDSTAFESVRGTMCVTKGCWFYEVQLITAGIMQIGWATKYSLFRPADGIGVGDDEHSFAFDGCRKLAWSSGYPLSYGKNGSWKEGDILGVYLDMEYGIIRFYLNGIDLGIAFEFTGEQLTRYAYDEGGFYPALSLTSFQQVAVNFGQTSFRYPPAHLYHNFSQEGKLPESLRLQSVYSRPSMQDVLGLDADEMNLEQACSICYDGESTVTLNPCDHGGLCVRCAALVENCPLCRTPILKRTTKNSTIQYTVKV